MGAKGRKRTQKRKAVNRTGLIKNLTGPYSKNQHDSRIRIQRELDKQKAELMKKFGLA